MPFEFWAIASHKVVFNYLIHKMTTALVLKRRFDEVGAKLEKVPRCVVLTALQTVKEETLEAGALYCRFFGGVPSL
jgi:hypothetical protein